METRDEAEIANLPAAAQARLILQEATRFGKKFYVFFS
jgi:hypothetical protein